MNAQFTFMPGSVVVFEGLDGAGKSTQLDLLSRRDWGGHPPAVAHMPSGLTGLTSSIYRVTEDEPIDSPLARQLLHLACHAENMPALVSAAAAGGLVLDRWWWSTMVYGWYAHGEGLGVGLDVFRALIDAVWSRVTADVVFLFETPFVQDPLNGSAILAGYRDLASADATRAVVIPACEPGTIADFILAELSDRGIVRRS